MALFALDQNFPEPIIHALNDYIPEAELIPLRSIDPLLAEIDDWQVLLALHHHEREWDGLITNDSRMLNLPREMAVLRQTNLTLVVAHDSGHDPIRATGLLFTHLGYICRETTQAESQVWELQARNRPARDAWHHLQRIAEHQNRDPRRSGSHQGCRTLSSRRTRSRRETTWSLGHGLGPRWAVRAHRPSFLDHVSASLGQEARGPVPNGGEPLPDEGSREKEKLRFIASGEDAVLALPDDAQATLAASAAVLDFVARPQTSHGLKTVCDRLADVRGPAEIDRLVSSIRAGRPPRERLETLARWLCRNGTTRAPVKAGIALLGVSGDTDDKDLIIRLGVLEELTLYSLVALRNLLPDSEDAVFDLAQQVDGWVVFRRSGA